MSCLVGGKCHVVYIFPASSTFASSAFVGLAVILVTFPVPGLVAKLGEFVSAAFHPLV